MNPDKDIQTLVKKEVLWWISQREKKLVDLAIDTMSLNPFLVPFVYDFHNCSSIGELFNLIVSTHLMTGHNTGFGKLVDEKILPNVFDAIKLDKNYRQKNPPLHLSRFDEIDHIVKIGNKKNYLSLKAGKWTIQLTMAVQLNKAFKEIVDKEINAGEKIVVGVFYGSNSDLTDKYEILRGINRGANHEVCDLTDSVEVKAGKEFWSWISQGDPDAQQKVLLGTIDALQESNLRINNAKRLRQFEKKIMENYKIDGSEENKDLWERLLSRINK